MNVPVPVSTPTQLCEIIPEPGTLAVAGLGVALVLLRRARTARVFGCLVAFHAGSLVASGPWRQY